MPQQNRILRPFDYDSIMLYGPKLFSRNGEDTMIPVKRGIRLLDTGVKNGLSDEDATSINLLYGCHDVWEQDASENSSPATDTKGQPTLEENDGHKVDEDTKNPKVNTIDNISGHKKSKEKDRKDIFKKPTGKPKSFYTPREIVNRDTNTRYNVPTTQARKLWSRSPWHDDTNRRTIKTMTTPAREEVVVVTAKRPVTVLRRRGQEEVKERRTTSSPSSATLAVKAKRERKESNVLRRSDRQREAQ